MIQVQRRAPVNRVLAFEAALLKHVRSEHPEILEELTRTGDLPDALANKIRQAVKDFKTHWKP